MSDFNSVKALLSESGIIAYEVEIPFKIVEDSIWFLTYDDFIGFMNQQNIKCAFIYEEYLDVENYLITQETMKEIDVREQDVEYIADIIDEYNESLLEEDIPFPENVITFCLWNNQKFCYIFQNEILFDGKPLMSADEKLMDMITNNKDAIIEDNKIKDKKLKKQIEMLEKEILNDPEFKQCTNNRLRRNYIYACLGENCTYDLVKQHWVNENGFLYHGAFDFIEKLWKQYKNNK